MDERFKFQPVETPPELGGRYLVSNGYRCFVAWFVPESRAWLTQTGVRLLTIRGWCELPDPIESLAGC